MTPRGTPMPMMHVTPPSDDHSRHDATSGQVPRYRKMELVGEAEPLGQVVRVMDIGELHAISSEEPSSFAEVEQSEC
jgi:hypothetical protein